MTTENVQYWKDAHALLLEENKKMKTLVRDIQVDGSAIIASMADELEKEFLVPLRKENKKLKEDLDATTIALDIVKAENAVNKKNAIMKVGKLFKQNKKLKTELEDVKDDISVMHGEDEVQELIMEISDLKEELEQEKDGREHDVQQFQSVLEEKTELEDLVKELKEKITTLVTFTIGGGDPEDTSDVEKIITDTMSKDFIDNNQEHWDLIGLFEEDN